MQALEASLRESISSTSKGVSACDITSADEVSSLSKFFSDVVDAFAGLPDATITEAHSTAISDGLGKLVIRLNATSMSFRPSPGRAARMLASP